ncbi:MAG: hypothetical protein AAFY03_09350, partial [Pseudomonadota bacterium]
LHVLVMALIGLSVVDFARAEQPDLTAGAGIWAAPKHGGVRRWQVAAAEGAILLDAPDGDHATGETIEAAAVVSNFGCIPSQGRVWCEVRRLHGGPRGFVDAEKLRPVAGPDGIVARGQNDSAVRAKRKQFDATAEIPCAQEQGQELGWCRLGVSRSEGGDATAAVTFSNGFTRLLFFMHGGFISASATMSGAGRDTAWDLADGIHWIRADDQRFEIPDALLFGG